MAEIILEKSTMQKVVYNKSERPADDTASAFYIFLYAPCILYASKKRAQ
jgi:hypothetical protein